MIFLKKNQKLPIFTVITGKNMISQSLGRMVRFHRKKAKLSQEGLAKISGVGKTVVFDIEQGKESIRLSTLVKILNTLNITISFSSPLMNLFRRHDEKS